MMQNTTTIPRYWRRSTTSFTREEYEQIINTPRPDREALRRESERVMREFNKMLEQRDASVKE